jgi:hypothetical protein
MFQLYNFLFVALLFFVLTPGVLITIPPNHKYLAALVHSLVFATVWYFTNSLVSNATHNLPGASL